jgi:YidC/Oxa1 family membrane protein insertase
MFDFLAGTLAFFYDLWPSYGMAIVLFTFAIYLVLTPLTIKSTRSMIAMQRVQPELKKLQATYKDDKETLQREMMAFYQANNINPFSSCLPMLLQMPIFFILFRVLNGLTGKTDSDGFFLPGYLSEDSAMYQALRKSKEMVSWGIDLSHSASGVLTDDGIVKALPFLLLVGLTAVTSWYQQKQVQGRNISGAAVNPQQQMITKFLPFIIVFFSFSMPAGVVVYFVVSAMVRIGQQAFVTRLEFPDGVPTPAANGAKPAKTPKSAPSAAAAPKNSAKNGAKESKPVPPSPRIAEGQQQNRNRNRRKKRK